MDALLDIAALFTMPMLFICCIAIIFRRDAERYEVIGLALLAALSSVDLFLEAIVSLSGLA